MDMRVGEIKEVQDHPNADKLYVLKVWLGEEIGEKIIVSGIKESYKKEELTGKKIIVITNLEPVVLRGVKSGGMLLAACEPCDGGEKVSLLIPDSDVSNGCKIS